MIVRRLSSQLPGGLELDGTRDELWGVKSLTQVSAGTLHEWMVVLGKVPTEARELLTYTARHGAWLSTAEVSDD